MMKLTVTLTDNGKLREAIPVRAVPLVTDWYISPDTLAISLSGEDGGFRYPHTAHIQSEGELKEIPPADWRLIADQLYALHASLPAGEAGKYEWRRRSIAELPAAAFLWMDEFSKAYRRAHNETAHLEHFAGEPLHTNGDVRFPIVVTEQLQRLALEGFPHESQTESLQATNEAESPLLRMRNALTDELSGVWPTIVNDLSECSRNGLDKAKMGAGNWCVQEAIRWAATKGKITKQKATTFIRADEGSEIAAFLRANFGI
jgi:hypothetical protein